VEQKFRYGEDVALSVCAIIRGQYYIKKSERLKFNTVNDHKATSLNSSIT